MLGPANPMFRYAVVRALTLGLILAVTFSQRGDESGFWVLLAMVIVSQPTGHAAWRSGVQRTVATLAGVVVFLIFLAVLPESALLAAALVAVLVSLLWVERSSTVVTACSTVLVIALAGVAQSDYTDWAFARLLDTVIGAVIGVLVSVIGESRPRPAQPTRPTPRTPRTLDAIRHAVCVISVRHQRDACSAACPLLVEVTVSHMALLHARRVLLQTLLERREHVAARMLVADHDFWRAAHRLTVVGAIRCETREYVTFGEMHGFTSVPLVGSSTDT